LFPVSARIIAVCAKANADFPHRFFIWHHIAYGKRDKTVTMPAIKEKTVQVKHVKDILIIEDEGEMCLLLNMILDDQDIHLDHVKTLSAAKEYLEREHPSLVLLDNRLPDGFGLDFISYIKKLDPSIKIIMISGIDRAAQDLALENGADGFLAKPFTKHELQRSIRSLLN
jgi:DNA-binding NtrC family response regulator